jgi:hypothetical protein
MVQGKQVTKMQQRKRAQGVWIQAMALQEGFVEASAQEWIGQLSEELLDETGHI